MPLLYLRQVAHVMDVFNRIRIGDFDKTSVLTLCPPELRRELEPVREYAAYAHEGQARQSTGRPYTDHLDQVWYLVHRAGGSTDEQKAAYVHDVPEDCQDHLQKTASQIVLDIGGRFGPEVGCMAADLTDLTSETALDKLVFAGQIQGKTRNVKTADSNGNLYDVVRDDLSRWPIHRMYGYLEYRHAIMDVLAPHPPLMRAVFSHLVNQAGRKWGWEAVPPETRKAASMRATARANLRIPKIRFGRQGA